MSIAHSSTQATPAPSKRERSAASLVAIGDLAREFGVTLRALRFYEDKGLLTPVRDGHARLYRASDRDKLSLILKGKKLGFTLTEIRDLLAGKSGSGETPTLALRPDQILSQIHHLKRQRDDIEDAIAQLLAAHARAASAS